MFFTELVQRLPSSLDTLASKQDEFSRSEFIYRKNEISDRVFFLVHGRIDLIDYTFNSSEILLRTVHKTECIGESALFGDKYTESAVAATSSRVLQILATDFKDLLARDAQIRDSFMKQLIYSKEQYCLGIKLRSDSAKERILTFARLHANTEGITRFNRPLCSIASEVGLTPESFYRAISSLENEGQLVRLEKRTFKLFPLVNRDRSRRLLKSS